jgi:hypothetical protein
MQNTLIPIVIEDSSALSWKEHECWLGLSIRRERERERERGMPLSFFVLFDKD